MDAARRRVTVTAFALVTCTMAGCRDAAPAIHAPVGPTPDSFRVDVVTSRGRFTIEAHRAWAPLGVDRFYRLVGEGFFDDDRFYRVLPGFIAQFGANDDPARNREWEKRPLADDPPVEHNRRGTVSYAFIGPGSRTHQLFVNLKDNPSLDAQGFVPIGRVVDGMGVVDSLYDDYGEIPSYQLIATMGNKYLARMFPKLDYIRSAHLVSFPNDQREPSGHSPGRATHRSTF